MKFAFCNVLITRAVVSARLVDCKKQIHQTNIMALLLLKKCKKKLFIPAGCASSGAGTGMACVNANVMMNIQPQQANIFCVTDMFCCFVEVS